MEERQTNYTIMEGYELPSNGLIYDRPVNAHIELRSMTARDEMKRLSPSTTPFKTLADIIEGCMIEKPAISVYDMALSDYEFLLHRLRVVTYGDEYKIEVGCPTCGAVASTTAHLDELVVTPINIEEFEGYRTFTLPKSNRLVTLKVQTPRILDQIAAKTKEMQRKYKTAEVDFSTLTTLKCCIEAIDGTHLDELALENFINTMPALDLAKIIKNIDAMNKCFGIDNNLTVSCSKCGEDVLTFFRFGPEFFRPSNI